MTAARRFLLTVLAVLGMAAMPLCSGAAFADTPKPTPGQHTHPAAPQPVPTGMVGDENSAVNAVDAFWKRHFEQFFHRRYSTPQVRGGYLGENGPSCGGEPAASFNAFYCKPGDFLAWDQNLMSEGYRQIGDSWVYLVISHEWGHAIQARLSHSLVSQADELQADCLAGATLQGALNDGLLRSESGDDQEIAQALTSAADKYPWSNKHDHGDAQQRINAYNKGDQGGVPACF